MILQVFYSQEDNRAEHFFDQSNDLYLFWPPLVEDSYLKGSVSLFALWLFFFVLVSMGQLHLSSTLSAFYSLCLQVSPLKLEPGRGFVFFVVILLFNIIIFIFSYWDIIEISLGCTI